MKRKIVSVLLCVLLLASLLPVSAFADTTASGTCGDNLTWTLDGVGTLTISGTGAMYDYDNYKRQPWYSARYHISSIVIGEGVTSIGIYTFSYLDSLRSVSIPASVTSIKDYAFDGCYKLTSVTIPDKVTSIGNYAFRKCYELTNIEIPNDVKSVGIGAFSDCSALTGITVGNENAYYYSDDGVLLNKDKTELHTYPAGKADTTYIIPNGVTNINKYAFEGNGKLTSVTIPDSVTSIGESAFSECGIRNIKIPNSVTKIESNAFTGSGLINVVLPDSVTSVGKRAFAYCGSLISVTMSNSMTSIESAAFFGCSSLKSVVIPNTVTSIGSQAFADCKSLKSARIPESIVTIGSSAFSGCGFESLVIPSHVADSMEGSAFSDCHNLKSVTICEGATDTGYATFYGCNNLQNVKLPKSLTKIGDWSFRACSNLKNIQIPENVTSIGNLAFCSSGLTSITIGCGVTSIGNYAFKYCNRLKSVIIPSSVSFVYEWAFSDCNNITDVYYQGTEQQWKNIRIMSGNGGITNATIHYNSFGAIATAVLSEEAVTISPKTKRGDISTKITGVKAQIGSVSFENTSENPLFTLQKSETQAKGVLSKSGYRDYIIPAVVMSSLKPGTNLDTYMMLDKKDGKPYISSVFGKNSDGEEYQDLFTSPLVAENYNTYDIIVSAKGLSSKAVYYIEQDAEHQLISSNGIFLSTDLYSKLDLYKATYVYAIDTDGKMTDLEKISISKATDDGTLNRILATSTYSLGGTDGISIKIPDGNPLFGNSTVSLDAFTAPLTVYYDATNDTFVGTIGFDLYSYEKEDKTVTYANGGKYKKFGDGETKKALQNFKESFSYFDKKPFAEEKKDNNGKSLKKQWQDFVKQCKKASSKTTQSSSKNFTTDFLGYIEFAYNEQGFVVKKASLKVGADFSYSYTYQGAVWVIPAYFKTTLGCSASLEGSIQRYTNNKDLPFDFNINLEAEPNVSLEGGVGVEKLAKAGVEAKGTVPILVEFTKNHFKLDFHGEINIKTKAFIFKWEKTLVDGTANLVDTYWGSGSKKAPLMIKSNGTTAAQDVGTESFVSRAYLSNTSAWLGGKSIPTVMKARSVSTDAVSVSTLQKSVFDNAKPVITTVGNKMLMAWIEDDASRDEYNRMRLVYSVYDGTNWSEPKAVYDDGKNDDAPAIVSDGNKVYFAWQKMTETLDSTATAAKAFQTVDTCTAEYDISTDTVSNVKRISTDGYDYAQAITVADHSPVVYFANCADESVAISQNSKIYKVSGDTKDVIVEASPYVNTITTTGNSMSYVADTDNDPNTFEDVNVLSYENGSFVPFEKPDADAAMTSAYYGQLNGKNTLFATDGANIYYYENGELKTVFADSHRLSNLSILSDDDSCMFVWSEMQDNTETMYGVKYADGSWSEPFTVSKCDGFWVDHLSIAAYNGKIAGVFMQDIPDTTGALVKITQANLAFMTAADYYDIALDSLTADEEAIIPGETAEVSVYVSNNSSQSVNEVEFTLSDSIGSDQTQTVDVDLKAGEAKNVTLTYTVPEDFKPTTLTVSAQISGKTEANTDDNSTTLKIGVADLRVLKSDVAVCDDNYIVTAYVKNNSQTTSGTVTANLYLDSEGSTIAAISEIGAIAYDEVGMVQFVVPSAAVTFDEDNAARFYFDFVDEQSKYGSTAKDCVLAYKTETTCAHLTTEDVDAVAATCTEGGKTAGKKCLGCGEIVSGCEETAPLGHDIVYRNVTAATCTESGSEIETCTRCDYTTHKELAALGHDFGEWTVTTKPTCTEKGTETKSCSRCDATETREIAALDHNYVGGFCTRCGEKDPNYVAAPVLKITTSAGKPKISWSKVDGAAKYKVFYSTDGKKYYQLIETTKTSVTHTKAKIGTKYFYKVRAVNAGAESEFSNVESIKCRPAAPTVTISRSGGKAKLSWKAVSGATKYWVYRSTDGKKYPRVAITTKLSYTDSESKSGTKYYYKVMAVAVVNKTDVGSACSAVKSIMTTLAKPTVKITTSNGKPKLSWSKVTGADKYYVYRSTDGKTFKHFATTTKLSYTNTGAKKGTKYYYKVKAICSANTNANSAFSAVVSIKATK